MQKDAKWAWNLWNVVQRHNLVFIENGNIQEFEIRNDLNSRPLISDKLRPNVETRMYILVYW